MTIKLSPREEAKVIRARLAAERRKAAKLARPKSERADRGRVRDNGYLAFLRRRTCCVANALCDGRIDPAHIRFGDAMRGKVNPGMSVKPDDRYAVPLCRHHHEVQHGMNERAFWDVMGIDPLTLAEFLYAKYQRRVPQETA